MHYAQSVIKFRGCVFINIVRQTANYIVQIAHKTSSSKSGTSHCIPHIIDTRLFRKNTELFTFALVWCTVLGAGGACRRVCICILKIRRSALMKSRMRMCSVHSGTLAAIVIDIAELFECTSGVFIINKQCMPAYVHSLLVCFPSILYLSLSPVN